MKLFKIAVCLIYACLLYSCGSNKDDSSHYKPVIAVSIEPQRQILESLAGDDFEVITILTRGANPETFETAMSQQAILANADAYVSLGMFPFEHIIESMLTDDMIKVDCSIGIPFIYGAPGYNHCEAHDRNHADGSQHPDPHYWISVRNAKIMAKSMVDALSRLRPGQRYLYEHRLDSLIHCYDTLDAELQIKLKEANHSFAIWHPSLTYFANDYGLNQISVGYESKDISPKKLQETIENAKSDDVKVLFFQKEFDSRQAKTISESLASRLVSIDPLSYEWMSQLNLIADELAK